METDTTQAEPTEPKTMNPVLIEPPAQAIKPEQEALDQVWDHLKDEMLSLVSHYAATMDYEKDKKIEDLARSNRMLFESSAQMTEVRRLLEDMNLPLAAAPLIRPMLEAACVMHATRVPGAEPGASLGASYLRSRHWADLGNGWRDPVSGGVVHTAGAIDVQTKRDMEPLAARVKAAGFALAKLPPDPPK